MTTRLGADDRGPVVASVVVPVRNVSGTIEGQLAALARQQYAPRWEIVVVDNASQDDTRAKVETWVPRLCNLRVVQANARRGVAHARNVGIQAARGEIVLICDGDDLVSEGWLPKLADALRTHQLVTGSIDLVTLNQPDQYDWQHADQLPRVPQHFYRHLPYVHGGNMGVCKEVIEKVGGFNEDLRRAEDADFSWRAHYRGYRVHFVPDAVVHVRMRSAPGAVASVRFRGGHSEPLLYRSHRAHGMPRQRARQVLGLYVWLLTNAPSLVTHPELRYQWIALASQRAGRWVGSIRHRSLFL